MHDLALIQTIAAGFAAAWVLGLITQKLGLSTIVGYLLAGVVIGEHTPGFEGDPHIAHQLSEIGVILLMFGVGLHFHFKDLLAVRNIAIPGAVVQSFFATLAAMVVFWLFGWTLRAGAVLGMAMAVASTVVLLRVLMDRNMVKTVHGHVAVGWLIVEDIFTVLVLVMVPVLALNGAVTPPADAAEAANAGVQVIKAGVDATHAAPTDDAGLGSGVVSILWAMAKLAMLVVIVLLAGSRVVPWVLVQVARLRSRELFTLTVLVLSVSIAVGSAYFFGASPALGAFLAGMVVAQSPVSQQAAADVLPLRDAFAVLFFVSVGMLFDPNFVMQQPLMVLAGVAIVMIVKPITALIVVAVLGYSARTALTVALGLSQIGEFSFILSQVSMEHGLLPPEGHHVLVATAMISITLNPMLFRSIDRIERTLQRYPALWKLLNGRAGKRMQQLNAHAERQVKEGQKPLAIIVGYGPVGRVVDALLRDTGLDTVIIDLNMDTVRSLTERGRMAIFGDATQMDILDQAGVKKAVYLVVTLPQSSNIDPLLLAARELNPKLDIAVRTRYLGDRERLLEKGVTGAVYEEGEAGIALARLVMKHQGVKEDTIARMLQALRRMWILPE